MTGRDTKIDSNFYEKVIINNIILNEGYLSSIIDHLKPEFFSDKNISKLVDIIIQFYHARGSVPTGTEIKTYLSTPEDRETFKQVLLDVKDFDRNLNKDELHENTEQFLKEKAVYNTLLSIIDKYDNNPKKLDTHDILNQFEKSCNISLESDIGLDYFDDIDKHITDLTTQDNTIPSGWDWLDRKLDGGFLENGRAIYVFAGETNVGKSIFLGNVATSIANQGKTVLLITLEMSELMYAKRISTNLTQIPIADLHKRADDIKTKIGYYTSAHRDSKIIIKEFPPNTVTCNHLKSFIEKVNSTGCKVDAIVLDYVNLLSSSIGNNSYERIKHATEQLRALTYHFDCPIITATQLNRQGYNEINPGLSTIGESIGLAATADCIMSIWQEEEDAELGIIKLGMMKNRFGANFGSVTMRIDYSTLTLTEDEELYSDNDELNTTAATLNDLLRD
jgi:replicative DNA helicase